MNKVLFYVTFTELEDGRSVDIDQASMPDVLYFLIRVNNGEIADLKIEQHEESE